MRRREIFALFAFFPRTLVDMSSKSLVIQSSVPATLVFFFCALAGNDALADSDLVVQIQCGKDLGSGVLIGKDGVVLTASHISTDTSACVAKIERLQSEPYPISEINRSTNGWGGMVMKIEGYNSDNFAEFCDLSGMAGFDVVAFGFDKNSVNEPARTEGIISTITPDDKGTIEVTARTVAGRSGGPVFLKNSRNLVGIIAGVEFNSIGDSVFRTTPVVLLDDIAELTASNDCSPSVKGYTIEDHEVLLDSKLAALSSKLSVAIENRSILEDQLAQLLKEKNDLEGSFQEREMVISEMQSKLRELSGDDVQQAKLDRAQAALYRGETALAYEVFAEIEADADVPIQRAADAAFERGKIAGDDFRWAAALEHFNKAYRLNPSHEFAEYAFNYSYRMNDDGIFRYSEDLLELAKSEFGNQSEEYADALVMRARALTAKGKREEALKFEEGAVRLSEELQLGNLGFALDAMAGTLQTLGRHEESEKAYLRALNISADKYGSESSDYASTLSNAATIYLVTGRMEEARRLMWESIEISKKLGENNHPGYATTLNNLALVVEDPEEAVALYAEALQIIDGILPERHALTYRTLGNYAREAYRKEDYSTAQPLYIRLISLSEYYKGVHSDEVFDVAHDLATSSAELGEYGVAANAMSKAIAVMRAKNTYYAIEIADKLNNRGTYHLLAEDYENALNNFEASLEIYHLAHGTDHEMSVAITNHVRLAQEGIDGVLDPATLRPRQVDRE